MIGITRDYLGLVAAAETNRQGELFAPVSLSRLCALRCSYWPVGVTLAILEGLWNPEDSSRARTNRALSRKT